VSLQTAHPDVAGDQDQALALGTGIVGALLDTAAG
jgi:hypothetical protein